MPLAAGLLLAGCGLRGLSHHELDQVRAGQKAVILVRLVGTENGKPFSGVGPWKTGHVTLGVGWADLEKGEPVKVGALDRSRSQKAAEAGWTYRVVEPGSHYLAVTPGAAYQRGDPGPAIGLLLQAPRGGEVVYAGTIHVPCRLRKLFFGEHEFEAFDAAGVAILDDHLLAEAEASSMRVGRPRTILARKYLDQHPERWPPGLAVTVLRPGELQLPDVQGRAVRAGAIPGASLAGLAGSSGGDPSGYGSGALMVVGVAIGGVGAGVGAVVGYFEAGHLNPYFQSVHDSVVAADPAEILRTELTRRWDGKSPVTVGDGAAVPGLTLQFRRIALRPCKGKNYCLEMVARASIRDAQGLADFDRLYAWTNPQADPLPAAYECAVKVSAPLRPLHDYAEPATGSVQVRADLAAGAAAIADQLAQDLGVGAS